MATTSKANRRVIPEAITPPPQARAQSLDLESELESKLIGQSDAVEAIVPYIETFRAGLAPAGRPAGVFLLLGPTGTGKTKTVELLAEILHGSEKSMVKVDCGEYQMDHEVAKLIGSPPGYLGHRETTPLLTTARLNASTSAESKISIVLFDEIEKAAPSMVRLLLGVLDKATLALGDNTTCSFENSLIFLTSNLGSKGIARALFPNFGFESMVPADSSRGLHRITLAAAKKEFPPEFMNRIDATVTYRPLDHAALEQILQNHIVELQQMIFTRLAEKAFSIVVTRPARDWMLRNGTSKEYGARELKRMMQRNVIQKLAGLINSGKVIAGALLEIDLPAGEETLVFKNRPIR
jgi:ATP-dependent Clp protease ATP-binding subunit ClpA